MKKHIFQVLIISLIVSVIVNLLLKNVDSFSTLMEKIIIYPFELLIDKYFDITTEYIFKPIFGTTNVDNFFGREIEIVNFPRKNKYITYTILMGPLLIMFTVLKVLFELIKDVCKLIRRKIK